MTTTEKLQMLTLFLEVIIFFLIVRKVLMCASEGAAMAERLEAGQEKPDLMEQAMHNISMRHMQKELREILAFSEPNHMRDLVVEYMRLREEQEKKETDVK